MLVTWWQKTRSSISYERTFWILDDVIHKSPKTKKISHELTKAVFKTAVREKNETKTNEIAQIGEVFTVS